jgi:hypothetical protein
MLLKQVTVLISENYTKSINIHCRQNTDSLVLKQMVLILSEVFCRVSEIHTLRHFGILI